MTITVIPLVLSLAIAPLMQGSKATTTLAASPKQYAQESTSEKKAAGDRRYNLDISHLLPYSPHTAWQRWPPRHQPFPHPQLTVYRAVYSVSWSSEVSPLVTKLQLGNGFDGSSSFH